MGNSSDCTYLFCDHNLLRKGNTSSKRWDILWESEASCTDFVLTCPCIGMLRRLASPTLPSLFIWLSVRLAVQFSRSCGASCAVLFAQPRSCISPCRQPRPFLGQGANG